MSSLNGPLAFTSGRPLPGSPTGSTGSAFASGLCREAKSVRARWNFAVAGRNRRTRMHLARQSSLRRREPGGTLGSLAKACSSCSIRMVQGVHDNCKGFPDRRLCWSLRTVAVSDDGRLACVGCGRDFDGWGRDSSSVGSRPRESWCKSWTRARDPTESGRYGIYSEGIYTGGISFSFSTRRGCYTSCGKRGVRLLGRRGGLLRARC